MRNQNHLVCHILVACKYVFPSVYQFSSNFQTKEDLDIKSFSIAETATNKHFRRKCSPQTLKAHVQLLNGITSQQKPKSTIVKNVSTLAPTNNILPQDRTQPNNAICPLKPQRDFLNIKIIFVKIQKRITRASMNFL